MNAEPGTVLVRWRAVPAAPVLVCVPWAGSGAVPFRPWADWLAPAAEIWGVRLPGRESRITEPPWQDLASATDECAGAVRRALEPDPRPFVLFGHCSGALLAYELAHELCRRGPVPAALVVASQGAPQLPRSLDGWRDDVAVLLAVAAAGIPDDPAVRDELLELLRPVVEADVQMSRGYTHRDRAPLGIPVEVLVSSEDAAKGHAIADGWSACTAAGLTSRVLPGDHLFTGDAWRTLAAAVAQAVSATATVAQAVSICAGPAGMAGTAREAPARSSPHRPVAAG